MASSTNSDAVHIWNKNTYLFHGTSPSNGLSGKKKRPANRTRLLDGAVADGENGVLGPHGDRQGITGAEALD